MKYFDNSKTYYFLIKCRIFDHTFMLLHRLAPGFPYINLDEEKKKRKNHKKVPIFCIFKISEKIQKIIVFWWFFLFENNLRNACASLCKRIKVYSKNASFWLFEKFKIIIFDKLSYFRSSFYAFAQASTRFPYITRKGNQGG